MLSLFLVSLAQDPVMVHLKLCQGEGQFPQSVLLKVSLVIPSIRQTHQSPSPNFVLSFLGFQNRQLSSSHVLFCHMTGPVGDNRETGVKCLAEGPAYRVPQWGTSLFWVWHSHRTKLERVLLSQGSSLGERKERTGSIE